MKATISNLTSKMLTYVLCSIMVAFLFAGCEHDVYNPNNGKDNQEPNTFNFSTTSTIQLNVKYDIPQGYQVLFEVYQENPFTIDKDGQTVKRTDLEPIIRRMTDENGVYNGEEVIAADHGTDAYIYTSYIGVPAIFKTTFNGNAITADISWETADTKSAQTRAGISTITQDGYKVLGTWNPNGLPNYLEKTGIEISSNLLRTINMTIPEEGVCPKEYRQSTDFELNDPEGREAEIYVSVIDGTSAAASVFGYYYYDASIPASDLDISTLPRCVIFPNTLMDNSKDRSRPVSGLKPGDSVKLLYFGKDGKGEGTSAFPNGIKIGWFILNNRFVEGKGAFYSTTELNKMDTRTHTAAFRINDFIVLSFEDWVRDEDYNDVIFNVRSTPIEAIINPDNPEIPDIPVTKPEDNGYSFDYKGILAFEDNWPKKGDYDMNDVIVKYNTTLHFNNNNKVLSAEDTYELLWSGATYKNGFAYQLTTDRTNVAKSEILEAPTSFEGQGLDENIPKATFNVFLSAVDVTSNNTKTATYKIKNTFNKPIEYTKYNIPPYNPFILVHDGAAPRTEVHLVNYNPTGKADKSLFHTEDDLSDMSSKYYVASGSYPFAIHLKDAEKFSTPETRPINESFPHFMDWVKSNGTEYPNWYK